MKDITCCITGHRDLPRESIPGIRSRLEAEVDGAIAEGYRVFISGFAKGADLMFAKIVAERCRRCPELRLEAAIPYRARLDSLLADPGSRQLLCICAATHVISEQYESRVFSRRNRYMVERSGRVIAVYDGRRGGGTAATISMARLQGCDIRILPVTEEP